jgi:hypothetical protein
MNAYELDASGPLIVDTQGAVDVIGEAWEQQADLLVIPVERLAPEFFRLSSGLAGEVLQKFVNYGYRVAIIGDVEAHLAASAALRDFVRESNSGRRPTRGSGVHSVQRVASWCGRTAHSRTGVLGLHRFACTSQEENAMPPHKPVQRHTHGAQLSDRVVALRSEGNSFASIAKAVGVKTGRDAFDLFVDAVAKKPSGEAAQLRQEENRRLDVLEKRTRTNNEGSDRDRKLASLQKLRDRLAGAK